MITCLIKYFESSTQATNGTCQILLLYLQDNKQPFCTLFLYICIYITHWRWFKLVDCFILWKLKNFEVKMLNVAVFTKIKSPWYVDMQNRETPLSAKGTMTEFTILLIPMAYSVQSIAPADTVSTFHKQSEQDRPELLGSSKGIRVIIPISLTQKYTKNFLLKNFKPYMI